MAYESVGVTMPASFATQAGKAEDLLKRFQTPEFDAVPKPKKDSGLPAFDASERVDKNLFSMTLSNNPVTHFISQAASKFPKVKEAVIPPKSSTGGGIAGFSPVGLGVRAGGAYLVYKYKGSLLWGALGWVAGGFISGMAGLDK